MYIIALVCFYFGRPGFKNLDLKTHDYDTFNYVHRYKLINLMSTEIFETPILTTI